MKYLVILAILLIPISSIVTIPGTCVWYPQLLMLEFMGGIFFASRFWNLNKFISIFIAYLFFSYIFIANASPRTMMCLFIGCAAIFTTLITSELKDLKWIYSAMIFMTIFSFLYVVLQICGKDPIFKSIDHTKFNGIVSFLGSRNQLGIYSAANAFWCPWLIPIEIIPIFFTKCNSVLIGLIAGTICYTGFCYGKKYTYIGLFSILVLLIPWWHYCSKGSDEIHERFNIWKLSLQQLTEGKIYSSDENGHSSVIKTNPLFGFGLGDFFSFSPMSQYKIWGLKETSIYRPKHPEGIQHFYEHMHNDLLEALYELGYIGFGIVASIVVSVVWLFISSPKSLGVITTFSSLLAQSVASLSVYVFHAPVSLFIFCLTLGLFYAEVNKNAKPSEVKQVTT